MPAQWAGFLCASEKRKPNEADADAEGQCTSPRYSVVLNHDILGGGELSTPVSLGDLRKGEGDEAENR